MKVLVSVLAILWSLSSITFAQGSIVAPKVTSNPDPEYPVEAASLGYGGTVVAYVTVDKKGRVSVKHAGGPAAPCSNLDDERIRKIRSAVVEAAKRATFEPALKDGKPLDVEITITYRFDSSGKPWRENAPTGKRIIDGGVLQGRIKYMAKPEYPSSARATRAAGAVPVNVVVDTDGNVIAAGAVGGHPLLRNSAEIAACASSIEPVVLSDVPVQVTGIITYHFVP
jgi:hypothetical protein